MRSGSFLSPFSSDYRKIHCIKDIKTANSSSIVVKRIFAIHFAACSYVYREIRTGFRLIENILKQQKVAEENRKNYPINYLVYLQ